MQSTTIDNIEYIKWGIGALYELCAPSIITHYALRITHYVKIVWGCAENDYFIYYINGEEKRNLSGSQNQRMEIQGTSP